MTKILKNFSLQQYNTFGIDVKADYFTSVTNIEELIAVYQDESKQNIEKMIIGGGSNVLFTTDQRKFVIKNDIKGYEIQEETDDHVVISSGGGEVWHDFVIHTINKNYGGLENLSLIPGCVGASPIQNIGAYGTEIKDTMVWLEALRLSDFEIVRFSNEECDFGYRDSIFKRESKGKYVITKVAFKLTKTHTVNTTYGAINAQLQEMGISNPSIQDVSKAVIAIRQSKLPDPKEIGNSGSFFKNPVINNTEFEKLSKNYPDVAHYRVDNNNVKLAAGWLIDQAGWKGYREMDFGVHEKQALVLVNHGSAKGSEIFNLSQRIMDSVKEKYGVDLEREVNIL